MIIRFFAAAQAAAGTAQLQLDTSNTPHHLAELLPLLTSSFPVSASPNTPALPQLLPQCSFAVDGRIHPRSEDYQKISLASANTVDVLPPFAGG